MGMKNKPIFISAQPCIIYYAWQVEVMLDNFKEIGIGDEYDIHCLIAYDNAAKGLDDSAHLFQKIAWKHRHFAKFFYYHDTRERPISYISSIRPNLLKQHFKENPELSERVFLYHDCDILLTKYPDFIKQYCEDDLNWYVSDTISYISHKYIKSKGQRVLNEMLSKFGISEDFIQRREDQSGGCQYIMKGVDWKFFHKMERDCEVLFRDVTKLNSDLKTENPTYHELQIWCSDMWSILWNAWMRGYTTKIIPELDFSWATDSIDTWDQKYIFHNAGVTDAVKSTHFYKSDYRTSLPYNISGETYMKEKASYKYFEQIKKTAENSCLL